MFYRGLYLTPFPIRPRCMWAKHHNSTEEDRLWASLGAAYRYIYTDVLFAKNMI